MSEMVSYTTIKTETLEKLVEGAWVTARDYLGQASKYEGLGQKKIADLTFDDHYKPLRDAIEEAESLL